MQIDRYHIIGRNYGLNSDPNGSYLKFETLRKVAIKAVEIIKEWHGEEVFDLYFMNAPEMDIFRQILGDDYYIKQKKS